MNALVRRLPLVLPVLAALTLLVATACGDDNDAPDTTAEIPRVTVTAKDYAFEMPDVIPAGLVRITLRNEGPEVHHAQPARLKDGVTFERFTAELQRGPEAALPLLSFPGGPAPVAQGGKEDVTLQLGDGEYVMLCFVESADGTPHLAKGMIKPFRVAAPSADARAPQADGEVALADFNFTLPALKAGPTTVRVTNNGPQIHEMGILQAAPGKTVADVQAFLRDRTGPPSMEELREAGIKPLGGMQALDPGASAWLNLDLPPGTYVAICNIPDPASGRPHADLGMIAPFTVQ